MSSMCLPATWPPSSCSHGLGALVGRRLSGQVPGGSLPGESRPSDPPPAPLPPSQLCPLSLPFSLYPSWQADCNPNLLLTSPLQPFQVKHYSRRREPLGSARPVEVCGRCWAEARPRPVATGPSLRCLWGCGGAEGVAGWATCTLYPHPSSCSPNFEGQGQGRGQGVPGPGGEGLPGTTEGLGSGQVRALLLAVPPAPCQAGGRTGDKMFRRAVSAALNRFSVPRPQCSQQQSGGRGCCLLNLPPIHPTHSCSAPACQ